MPIGILTLCGYLFYLTNSKQVQIKALTEDKNILEKRIIELSKDKEFLDNMILEKEKMISAHNAHMNAQLENILKNGIDSKMTTMKDEIREMAKYFYTNYRQEKETLLIDSSKIKDDLLKKAEEEFTKVTQRVVTELSKTVSTQGMILSTLSSETQKILNAFIGSNKSGEFGEVVLSAKLEQLGFKHNETFFTQFSTSDKNRPDVVIKLPGDNFLVIDSKNSIHWNTNNDENQEIRKKNLAESMKRHIKTLSSKEYAKSVSKELKDQNIINTENHQCNLVIMYLPTDSALEEVRSVYPECMHDARQNNIMLCGPSALDAILAIISRNIATINANNNYLASIEMLRHFLKDLASLFDNLVDIGKSLRKGSESYYKFQNQWNGKLFKNLAILAKHIEYKNDIPKMPEYHFTKTIDDIEDVKESDRKTDLIEF